MAEYFPLLERAVSGLPNSTPEARNALYERARSALLGQLRLSDPPVPESDIERESVALDEAIARVEANLKARQENAGSTEADPLPTAPPAPVASATPPPAPIVPVSSPAFSSGARPAIPPRPPRPPIERGAAGGVAPGPSSPPARERPAYPFRNLDPGAVATRAAPSVRPNAPIGEDASASAPRLGAAVRPTDAATPGPVGTMVGDAVVDRGLARTAPQDWAPVAEGSQDGPTSEPLASVGDERAQPGRGSRNRSQETAGVRPAVPVRTEHEPRSRAGLFAVVATLLLLVGGVGVAAYILRDRPEQIVAARPEVTVADDSPNKIVNRAEPPANSTSPLGRAADQPAMSVPAQPPAAPSDTATLPAPIPLGSERASQGPQASTAPNDQSGLDSNASPATAEPAIGVSQRAGMLVDAPEDPQKVKTYAGSVVWRMESISAGQGQPLSNAVRADIEIPDAKVAMSMVLKRNVEPQFPASHTIEFHFVEQPGNALGPVKQINVPELRRDDSAPSGDALAGVPVSITDDYFLVGLSRGGAEASNLQLLTQRNWIDISIMLNSGKIAKVAFEKGTPGQKIIEDALASWR